MSQDKLVDLLKAEGVVKHQDVESALRATDRRAYCPAHLPAHYVYQDHPLPIGYGETISAPSMHAICLELLRKSLKPGARVLDVGSGSGYLTAAMALMIKPNGKVIGVEKHPELTEFSTRNIMTVSPELLESGLVELRSGNILGQSVVQDNEPQFDAIHVGAAAERLPDILVQTLAPKGRMVIPVGPQWEHQVMQCIDKDASGHVHRHNLMAVRYVPLTKPGEE